LDGRGTAAQRPPRSSITYHGHVFRRRREFYMRLTARNNRIRRIAAETGIVTTVATGGSPSVVGPVSRHGRADDRHWTLEYVRDMVADAAGDLFVADQWHQSVRKVETRTGRITTRCGQRRDRFQGWRFSGDGGPAVAARLNSPSGLTIDGRGTSLSRIRVTIGSGWWMRQPESFRPLSAAGPEGWRSGPSRGTPVPRRPPGSTSPKVLRSRPMAACTSRTASTIGFAEWTLGPAVINTVAGTGASGRAAPGLGRWRSRDRAAA